MKYANNGIIRLIRIHFKSLWRSCCTLKWDAPVKWGQQLMAAQLLPDLTWINVLYEINIARLYFILFCCEPHWGSKLSDTHKVYNTIAAFVTCTFTTLHVIMSDLIRNVISDCSFSFAGSLATKTCGTLHIFSLVHCSGTVTFWWGAGMVSLRLGVFSILMMHHAQRWEKRCSSRCAPSNSVAHCNFGTMDDGDLCLPACFNQVSGMAHLGCVLFLV